MSSDYEQNSFIYTFIVLREKKLANDNNEEN